LNPSLNLISGAAAISDHAPAQLCRSVAVPVLWLCAKYILARWPLMLVNVKNHLNLFDCVVR
jgi:hypothetical protein